MDKKLRGEQLDLEILKELGADPNTTNEALARRFGVAPRTVEDSLKRLRLRGWIREQKRSVDLAASGMMLRYRIDVKINPHDLHASRTIGALRKTYGTHNVQELLAYYIRDVVAGKTQGVIVEEVSILLGDPADLCATVLVPDQRTIFEFVTEHLRDLIEIENTSTSLVAWRIFKETNSQEKSNRPEPPRDTSHADQGIEDKTASIPV